jgi:argininosuccinate lyase
MYLADVRGSIAYSKALLKVGILTQHEADEIERGLGQVASEWETKKVSTFASVIGPVCDGQGANEQL